MARGNVKSRKIRPVPLCVLHMTLPPDQPPRFKPRPWTSLETPQDVELWIDEHNAAMQELIAP